ncbi:MAG: hypothetical protein KGI29_00195 [Pseudomonadota bacterium]|nr:hypothetical protein [Pseudomonadota bacterium]
MAFRTRSIIIPLFLALCALPPAARADIGSVGGLGPTDAPQDGGRHGVRTPPVSETPLLVIRFNHFVYFERALKEAVDSTQQVKPGASYRLVNSIPAGNNPSQTQRLSQQAPANLQAVTDQMKADGVPESKIRVETVSGDPGGVQEIDIFVE